MKKTITKPSKVCPMCKKEFQSRRKTAKYCSQKCQWDSKRLPPLTEPITEKKCASCKEVKPVDEYTKNKLSRDGYWQYCNGCNKKRRKPPEIKTFNCVDCGEDIIRKIYSYTKPKFICSKCSIHRIMASNNGKTTNYTGTDVYTGKEFAGWKSSAKRRNYKWFLTKEDLDKLFNKQKGCCALSGIVLETLSNSPYRPSLDRIDSTKDYTIDNVQFTCSIVNVMKNKLPDSTFIDICKKIAKHNL